MKHRIFIVVLFIFCWASFPVSAQFGGGGRGPGSGGGLFGEAKPANQARTITVGGRLQPLRKINHSISVNGFIDEILVEVGDRVNAGQPLLRIKRDAVGETFLPVILESRVKGVVSEINIYETEQVTAGSRAVTIIDDSGYVLIANISDRDAQAIRNLGTLSVTAVSPDGESFTGKIIRVSQEPDYSTGLFNITIEFRKHEGLFLGMVLFVDLPIQKASGITIEKSAVVNENGSIFIWMLTAENTLSLRPLTVSQEKDGKVTVEKGISAGERYLIQISGNEEEGLSLKDLLKLNMNNTQSTGRE